MPLRERLSSSTSLSSRSLHDSNINCFITFPVDDLQEQYDQSALVRFRYRATLEMGNI